MWVAELSNLWYYPLVQLFFVVSFWRRGSTTPCFVLHLRCDLLHATHRLSSSIATTLSRHISPDELTKRKTKQRQ